MAQKKASGRKHGNFTIQKTRYPGVYAHVEDGKNPDTTFYITYRDINRKQHHEPVGRASQGLTAAKANQIRSDRIANKELGNVAARERERRQKLVPGKPPDFRKLWEVYDSDKADRRSRREDIGLLKYLGDKFLDRNPATLTTRDITQLKIALGRRRKARIRYGEGDRLSPQTVKHVLAFIRRVLRYADRQGLFEMPRGLVFDMPAVDGEKTEHMTEAQRRAYWKFVSQYPDRAAAAYLMLIELTGIRKTAALCLQWSDIDAERRQITLQGAYAKNGKTISLKVSRQAIDIINSIPRQPDSPWLFPRRSDPARHREGFKRIAEKAREAAGLPRDFRPIHGLRHDYATRLAASGKVDIVTLQAMLTHESTQTTRRYIHVLEESMQATADLAEIHYDDEPAEDPGEDA